MITATRTIQAFVAITFGMMLLLYGKEHTAFIINNLILKLMFARVLGATFMIVGLVQFIFVGHDT
jgi:hypothetical protein